MAGEDGNQALRLEDGISIRAAPTAEGVDVVEGASPRRRDSGKQEPVTLPPERGTLSLVRARRPTLTPRSRCPWSETIPDSMGEGVITVERLVAR
jgi:hypothetical protein